MRESFFASSETVKATFGELVECGFHGCMAPAQTNGPCAAMVDDPDSNVILITAG